MTIEHLEEAANMMKAGCPYDQAYLYLPLPEPPPSIIRPEERESLRSLALISSGYRSGMAKHNPATVAREGLINLAQMLYNRGVPIKDLAEAANISYPAMRKRIKQCP